MFETNTHLLADNPSRIYQGIAVSDLDGDGAYECVVGAQGGRNLVLKWGGDAFYDVAVDVLADQRGPAMGIAAGDVDGDGREEIYVANGEAAPDRLFAWRRGGWVDLFAGYGARPVSSGAVLALDRFGMGRYGFLVANEGGPFRFFELMSEDRLEDHAPVMGLARIAGGRSLVAGPIVSAGQDVYAGNEGIGNMLFVAGGQGQFLEQAAHFGLADAAAAARGVALIDVNFDGRFDIVCANAAGEQRIFVQGAQGSFAVMEMAGWGEARRGRSVVVADFDNDGFEEIFLHCHGESNRLLGWRDGDWRGLDCGAAVEPAGYGSGAAVGDWNGDGRLELLLAHGEGHAQPLSLYGSEGNGNHWLRLAVLTAQGAPARGAVVRMQCEGRVQMRVIDCGSGYLCQMEPVAHFGLGKSSSVDWVEIRWLDGVTQRILAPRADFQHRVAYPSG